MRNRWTSIAENIDQSTRDRIKFTLNDGVEIEAYLVNGELVVRKIDEGITNEGSLIIKPSVSNQIYIK